MQASRITLQEISVHAGKQTKLPVRLILQTVPDEVYAQRIREKTRKSKGQGRGQLTEETKIRCRFNLFITNAEEFRLSVKQVFPLYRLRWQIELQFKAWKSVFKIDTLHTMKEQRYITLLYVKLILIIINLQITYSLQQAFVQPKKDKIKLISLNKALKTLKTLFDKIFSMLRGTGRKARETAQYIQDRLLKNHWLESKKKKLCFPEILQLIICESKK
jgi:transposase